MWPATRFLLRCNGKDRGERVIHSPLKGKLSADEWPSIIHLAASHTHLHSDTLERFSVLNLAVFEKVFTQQRRQVVRCQAFVDFLFNFQGRGRLMKVRKKCDNRLSSYMTPEECQVPVFMLRDSQTRSGASFVWHIQTKTLRHPLNERQVIHIASAGNLHETESKKK